MDTWKLKSIDLKKFQRLTSISVKGDYFRSVVLKHENEILSAGGSFQYGGRYNPQGEFGALYAGENKEVCKAEIKIKGENTAPHVMVKLRISLTKVLDLTDTKNLKILGIKKEDLMVEKKKGGWNLTWHIARLAYRSDYEAIRTPAITSLGNCLIIFDKYVDPRKVRIISKTYV